ncbi:hypothetical protein BGL52_00700 [Lacticaseibacillus casei]|uniref:Uncharacterized protein n=1 Tax=Lacticaseibacillus casei TaxID=1582 RepID=A0AAN1C5Y5_LACCA|nr:hypothetical protein BGL52_00700 [Lacticaseibacillus casei]
MKKAHRVGWIAGITSGIIVAINMIIREIISNHTMMISLSIVTIIIGSVFAGLTAKHFDEG